MKTKHCIYLSEKITDALEDTFLKLRKKLGSKVSKTMIIDSSLAFFFANPEVMEKMIQHELEKRDKK